MATLVVFKFPTVEGANIMLYTLEGLQKQQLIQINGRGMKRLTETNSIQPVTEQRQLVVSLQATEYQ